MIDNTIAIWVGVLQGISEMFPVSSFGQSIIIPYLLKGFLNTRTINLNTEGYFQLIIITHLATALVLFYQYRSQWLLYIRQFIRKKSNSERFNTMLFKLALASLPVLILGFLLNHYIEYEFSSNYKAISILLIVNGVIFLLVERNRHRKGIGELTNNNLSHKSALKIGIFQAIALLPGLSRLGLVMVGSRIQNYSYVTSCYIAYLLSLPVIVAATIFKILEVNQFHLTFIIGFFSSVIASYIAINLMTRFIKFNQNLLPFAIFTITEGSFTFIYACIH